MMVSAHSMSLFSAVSLIADSSGPKAPDTVAATIAMVPKDVVMAINLSLGNLFQTVVAISTGDKARLLAMRPLGRGRR